MKRKKYKILACALSMGLAFTPNAALAAGTGLSEADEANLEEDVDDSWEDEESEDVEDDFWEDEVWDAEDACCDEENAEVTESQEENGMPYIAGTRSRNYYKAEDAESRDDTIAGVYTPIRKTQLYASAGAEDTAFLEVDENTKIHCYGYYTEADGAKWYYVQYFQNGRSFIGFCSSEELK